MEGEKSESVSQKSSESKPEHEFNFPFEPYEIQKHLMKVAYDTYVNNKFALLESPTGTGKSLSLICSAITWLKDSQEQSKKLLMTQQNDLSRRIEELKQEEDISGDWLSAQTKVQDVNRELTTINSKLDKILNFERRSEARRHAKLHGIPLENYSNFISSGKQADIEDLENQADNLVTSSNGSNAESLDKDDIDLEKKATQEEDHLRPKIYYASRTHSQLSQFVNEIKRTKFADTNLGPPVKVAPLASRANLCVNPDVIKLKDSSAINERCMELQKEKEADKRCPYAKAKQLNMLKDDILSSVQDIEDIVNRGKIIGSCPYYSARLAIPEAEVVVLPYNNLLHRETRQASSLDLKESVVIVDEAHNILDTICAIHSAPINGQQLIRSHTILSRYYMKYHSRMSPKNASVVKVIVQCLTALISYLNNPRKHLKDYDSPKVIRIDNDSELEEATNQDKCEEIMIDIPRFIGSAKIDRFNVFRMIDFFNRSQLARKLLGFFRQDSSIDITIELYGVDKESNAQNMPSKDTDLKSPMRKKRKATAEVVEPDEKEIVKRRLEQTNLKFLSASNANLEDSENLNPTYPVYTFIEFLRSLTNQAGDGRILTTYNRGNILQSSLKFILLNPSSQFKQMTEEARSIVLAGGTMQPFDEFVDLLFGPLGIERERLTLFSCGHVIKSNHLFLASLTHGPTGKLIELSYKTRSSLETIDDIGRTVMNISSSVPGGMVCFFPSYNYEQTCFDRWTKMGLIANIETRSKRVFREPRQSAHMKPILDEYTRTIEKGRSRCRGALLLCVVGGKMSEGINFNDDLGRCVVMIGLPYANIKSGELQQKMSFYDNTCKRSSNQQGAGQQYYENLCLKGINQSIGRAIRHKNDYAAIILLDQRYSNKTLIRSGLPGWMRDSLVDYDRFGSMFAQIKTFFKNINQSAD